MTRRFWIRYSRELLDIYFDPGSRLHVMSTDGYLLWISYGWRAERQFTINRWWFWSGPVFARPEHRVRGFQWLLFAYRRFT